MSELKHYGIARRSGRYPWGSGDNPYQNNKSFLAYVKELKDNGLSEKEQANAVDMSIAGLRKAKSLAASEIRAEDYSFALRLRDKGYSYTEIGRRMGINESSVRSLLDPAIKKRSEITKVTSNMLKEAVNENTYIDIGKGVERHLGISRTKLLTAVEDLKDEGYTVHYLSVLQAGTGKKTSLMVLAKPETTWSEVNDHKVDIRMPTDYKMKDKGRSYEKIKPPQSINSSEVYIRFGDQGGSDKDGVLELRRGVEHLDLGNSRYAQVRVAVDDKHFMKGMAMYSDDIPKGYNVVYNTNKKTGTPPEKVFKPLADDPKNPFGASIKRIDGQRGVLNIINEEGDWSTWSNALSSQFLSKQKPTLIRQQLDLSQKIKQEEYEAIMALTNPVIKNRLLYSFADDVDALAVDLKAAALPRQANHIILPFPNMKENEIYAPNYRDGEQVVLIRHPHGGTFEIPVLKVNNRQKDIQKVIGRAPDAVGIHPKTAAQLSGADFDGDSVIVIPNRNKMITATSPLRGLKDFDPQISYPAYEGMPQMKSRTKQKEMGDISNLITDMTIKGANEHEIAAAVRHSMVVIDAEKHHLNYKQSAIDNNIASLKKKYQGGERAGAATIVSRASSDYRVPERKQHVRIDPNTGKKIYTETGEEYINKAGKVVQKTTKSKKMLEFDPYELSSGTVKENIYADFATKMKSMADEARKEAVNLPKLEYSPSANKTYAEQVKSLDAQLNIAIKNAPLERRAQTLAESIIKEKQAANPDMDKDKFKKIKNMAIIEARERTGASKTRVKVSPIEWEAIQAGAISHSKLNAILDNADLDVIKKYATPREGPTISQAKLNKAQAMLKSGYTQAEAADAIGVAPSTLSKLLG